MVHPTAQIVKIGFEVPKRNVLSVINAKIITEIKKPKKESNTKDFSFNFFCGEKSLFPSKRQIIVTTATVAN
ncbi:MAG: hypothetical protein Q8876_03320 [Bacillota bacterium]|nr:hypothetical protein [Bacillota bacterium]